MATETQPLADLYQLCLTGGGGKPGAPLFQLQLLVHPSGHTVTGVVSISQEVPPPNNHLVIHVTGTYHQLLTENVIILDGTYAWRCPPPEKCIINEPFRAVITMPAQPVGAPIDGCFQWGIQRVCVELSKCK